MATVGLSFGASSAMAGGPHGHGHGHGHVQHFYHGGVPGHYDYHRGHVDYHHGNHVHHLYGAPRVYSRVYSPSPFYGGSYYRSTYYGGGGGFYLNGRNFSVGVGF